MAIKILIGGSPCTYWSIAQKNNRETEASGMGWELFKNYLIAKEKFKPDFFLYENNKSAAQAIKDQIAKEFGVGVDPAVRFTYINSALVSAQNRQRFYVTNFGDIEQPEDRGILLKDILECGYAWRDKQGCVDANYFKGGNFTSPQKQSGQRLAVAEPVALTPDGKAFCLTANYPGVHIPHSWEKSVRSMVAEPVNITKDGKSQTIKAQYQQTSPANILGYTSTYGATGVAEPVRVGSLPRPNGELSTSQAMRVYDVEGKSVNLTAQGGGLGAKTGLDAIPVRVPEYGNADKSRPVRASYAYKGSGEGSLQTEAFPDNPNKQVSDYVAEPVEISEPMSPCDPRGREKSRTLSAGYQCCSQRDLRMDIETDGFMGKQGVAEPIGYATPVEWDENGRPTKAISCADGKTYIVYEVKDGLITIKGKQYPIKLADGFYIIRKLTVTECARLQTMPDDYCKAVSDSQAYKALGNGWTAEVIIHLLNHALKDVPRDEEIIVLSLYDGIATGRYCLDKMGFTNVKYHAYEIDPYPIKIAMDNYPDIIQHGDAFAVREDNWKAPQTRSEWLDELLGV